MSILFQRQIRNQRLGRVHAAYGSLDGEGRNALESAAWSYAEQTALENNSGGQYTVDTKWMEHIDAMEELRKGIYLRSYGQRDPVVEYRIEGFNMFDEMVASIREDTSRMLLTMELRTEQPLQREQVAKPTGESGADDGSVKKQPAKKIAKPGRNDPCPCGSGKKYKKCCGAAAE